MTDDPTPATTAEKPYRIEFTPDGVAVCYRTRWVAQCRSTDDAQRLCRALNMLNAEELKKCPQCRSTPATTAEDATQRRLQLFHELHIRADRGPWMGSVVLSATQAKKVIAALKREKRLSQVESERDALRSRLRELEGK